MRETRADPAEEKLAGDDEERELAWTSDPSPWTSVSPVLSASGAASAPQGGDCARLLSVLRLGAATVVHGIGTGLIGVFIAVLIRQVQELGYGDERGGFLEIAMQAPPWRRATAVVVGGIFGAFAWYWLRGREVVIVSVDESLEGAKMPPIVTVLNGMVQDIVVALGGSFGREAAPREIAAMWGGQLADAFGVTKEQRRILVACGTGAGLAAVYSVPISGALYTLEHVLHWELTWTSVLLATSTSWIATVVGGLVVEDAGLYAMPKYSYRWPSLPMLLWAAMSGPLAGVAAVLFRWLVKRLERCKPQPRRAVAFQDVQVGDWVYLYEEASGYERRKPAQVREKGESSVTLSFAGSELLKEWDRAEFDELQVEGPRDWLILVVMPAAFIVLGGLSFFFPSLLGNGRALAEVAIHRQRTLPFFCMLLVFKALMTAGAIGAGAAGGTLTPSVALGATLGAIVGESWQLLQPDVAPKDDAHMSVVTAAAFLAVMLRSPFTSLWLMLEFSAQGLTARDRRGLLHGDLSGLVRSKLLIGMWLPLGIAIAGAIGATHACDWAIARCQPVLAKVRSQDSKSSGDPFRSEPQPALNRRASRMSERMRAWTHDLDLGERPTMAGDGYVRVSFIRASSLPSPEEKASMALLKSDA